MEEEKLRKKDEVERNGKEGRAGKGKEKKERRGDRRKAGERI